VGPLGCSPDMTGDLRERNAVGKQGKGPGVRIAPLFPESGKIYALAANPCRGAVFIRPRVNPSFFNCSARAFDGNSPALPEAIGTCRYG